MKKIRWVPPLALVILSTPAFGIDVTSRIDAVTVYPQGATVTRVASANLAAGRSEVRLTGLPADISMEYLLVEVGTDGVRIDQVRLGEEQQRDAVDPQVAAKMEEIRALSRRIQSVEDSSNAARLRLSFLESMAKGFAGEAGRDAGRGIADVNSWQAALDLLQSGGEDASRLIRDNDAQKEELQRDLSVLQRELAGLRGSAQATSAVELSLETQTAVSTTIRVSYYQEDAAWEPGFVSRLDSEARRLELELKAGVWQETEEDWDNVVLTLASSNPGGALESPAVRSRFLDLRPPVDTLLERRAMMSGAAMSADEFDSIEEIVVSGARRWNVGNYAMTVELPGRRDVPNDLDEAAAFDFETVGFDVELVTRAVPRETLDAFLTASFVYANDMPLLGGAMSVFVDGVYAGITGMPPALPGAELVLPMGQDRRVEVRSETQGGEGGTGGIINRRVSEVTDYVFEVTNRRGIETEVEIFDVVPVPRNDDIDVDVPRSATRPDESDFEDQPGVVVWRKSLAPGEAWRIRHQYTVSYPSDQVLLEQ